MGRVQGKVPAKSPADGGQHYQTSRTSLLQTMGTAQNQCVCLVAAASISLGCCPVLSVAKHQRGSRHRAFLACVVGRLRSIGTQGDGRSPRSSCPGGASTHKPNLRNVTATPQCPGVFIVVLIGPCGSRFWESHPSVKATSRRRTANETPAIAAQESSPVGDDDWQAANRYKVSVLRWESYPPFKALAAERWNIRPL